MRALLNSFASSAQLPVCKTALRIGMIAVALTFTQFANAQEKTFSDISGPNLQGQSVTGRIKSMEQLPGIWTAIEIDGSFKEGSMLGKPTFLSQNGRYVIVGAIYDLWDKQQRSLDSLQAIRNSLAIYPLEALGVSAEEMGAIDLPSKSGNADTDTREKILVYLDPLCTDCANIYKQIDELRDKYDFKILLVPVSGRESAKVVQEAACAQLPEQVWDAILYQDDTKILKKSTCNPIAMNKRFVMWQMAGFSDSPVFIRENGRVIKGQVSDLASQL